MSFLLPVFLSYSVSSGSLPWASKAFNSFLLEQILSFWVLCITFVRLTVHFTNIPAEDSHRCKFHKDKAGTSPVSHPKFINVYFSSLEASELSLASSLLPAYRKFHRPFKFSCEWRLHPCLPCHSLCTHFRLSPSYSRIMVWNKVNTSLISFLSYFLWYPDSLVRLMPPNVRFCHFSSSQKP